MAYKRRRVSRKAKSRVSKTARSRKSGSSKIWLYAGIGAGLFLLYKLFGGTAEASETATSTTATKATSSGTAAKAVTTGSADWGTITVTKNGTKTTTATPGY